MGPLARLLHGRDQDRGRRFSLSESRLDRVDNRAEIAGSRADIRQERRENRREMLGNLRDRIGSRIESMAESGRFSDEPLDGRLIRVFDRVANVLDKAQQLADSFNIQVEVDRGVGVDKERLNLDVEVPKVDAVVAPPVSVTDPAPAVEVDVESPALDVEVEVKEPKAEEKPDSEEKEEDSPEA